MASRVINILDTLVLQDGSISENPQRCGTYLNLYRTIHFPIKRAPIRKPKIFMVLIAQSTVVPKAHGAKITEMQIRIWVSLSKKSKAGGVRAHPFSGNRIVSPCLFLESDRLLRLDSFCGVLSGTRSSMPYKQKRNQGISQVIKR